MASKMPIRLPSAYSSFAQNTEAFTAPSPEQVVGTYYITHSASPLWRDKRNATVTFSSLPSSSASPQLDTLTTYQHLSSDATKSAHGTDTLSTHDEGTWHWRGNGWLKIASSTWEILAWGVLEGGEKWMVTYAGKTLLSPESLCLYSGVKQGFPGHVWEEIRRGFEGLGNEEFGKRVQAIYEVVQE